MATPNDATRTSVNLTGVQALGDRLAIINNYRNYLRSLGTDDSSLTDDEIYRRAQITPAPTATISTPTEYNPYYDKERARQNAQSIRDQQTAQMLFGPQGNIASAFPIFGAGTNAARADLLERNGYSGSAYRTMATIQSAADLATPFIANGLNTGLSYLNRTYVTPVVGRTLGKIMTKFSPNFKIGYIPNSKYRFNITPKRPASTTLLNSGVSTLTHPVSQPTAQLALNSGRQLVSLPVTQGMLRLNPVAQALRLQMPRQPLRLAAPNDEYLETIDQQYLNNMLTPEFEQNQLINNEYQADLEAGYYNYVPEDPDFDAQAELLEHNFGGTDTYNMIMHPETIQNNNTPIIQPGNVPKQELAFYPNSGMQFTPKALLAGNPLSKQLSKNGTISIKSIQSYLQNPQLKDIDKYLISQVLENHAGEKVIDYNQFIKEVQQLVPQYDLQQSTIYEKYGLEGINRLTSDIPITLRTFQLQSSQPNYQVGDEKHYTDNTLGHFRTFTEQNSPETLYVLESQSDLAQNGWVPGPKKKFIESELNNSREFLTLDNLTEKERRETLQNISNLESKLDRFNNPLNRYLASSYQERQLQQILKYAAEQGQTKVRYPTRQTAVAIEGYTPIQPVTNARELSYKALQSVGNDIKNVTPYTQEIFNIQQKIKNTTDPKKLERLNSNLIRIQKIEDRWRAGETTYSPNYETVLSNYERFPQLYRSLFGKKSNVNIVTDAKGNTWYEVDVPQSYIDGTGQLVFKKGGIIDRFRKSRKEIPEDLLSAYDYVTDSHEAAANFFEAGQRLGIKAGSPYPGDDKVLEIINSSTSDPRMYGKSPLLSFVKTDSKSLQNLWKALTGTLFMFPIMLYGANNKTSTNY